MGLSNFAKCLNGYVVVFPVFFI